MKTKRAKAHILVNLALWNEKRSGREFYVDMDALLNS